MTTSDALLHFVSTELLDQTELIESDDNLLSDGMVDSLGMLRLIAFIEAEFAIKVPPEDFTIENFRTITVICDYLNGRSND